MRYVSSYLEKSGWSLPFGVVSSLVAWRSPTHLEAPDLLSLGDGLLGRSTIQVCTGFFGVPTDVAFKVYVASSEVPSSSWESASSCSFDAHLFVRRRVEWRLRWPALKMTEKVLQGLGCIFDFIRGVFVRNACKLLYQ